MTQKQNAAMNQAIDLLLNSDTDISTIFKEDGLLKQLTNVLWRRRCSQRGAVKLSR